MKIRDVLRTINRMKADGVFERYAIGGAVGATFYLEAVATLDVDVFITIIPKPGTRIVSIKPIYDYLIARGCRTDGEHIVVADWPVQFLPAADPLIEEALDEARVFDVEGEPASVFSAEHLAAIALQTGRTKDRARLAAFIEAQVLDAERLKAIIARHGLQQPWRRYEKRMGQERT